MPNTQVLAALLAFRVSYLLIPFFLSIFVVFAFERNKLKEALYPAAPPPLEVKPAADNKRRGVS
jgi:4-amino-4-deoxy-L-arabinose transferase-like glycosyltransferase